MVAGAEGAGGAWVAGGLAAGAELAGGQGTPPHISGPLGPVGAGLLPEALPAGALPAGGQGWPPHMAGPVAVGAGPAGAVPAGTLPLAAGAVGAAVPVVAGTTVVVAKV